MNTTILKEHTLHALNKSQKNSLNIALNYQHICKQYTTFRVLRKQGILAHFGIGSFILPSDQRKFVLERNEAIKYLQFRVYQTRASFADRKKAKTDLLLSINDAKRSRLMSRMSQQFPHKLRHYSRKLKKDDVNIEQAIKKTYDYKFDYILCQYNHHKDNSMKQIHNSESDSQSDSNTPKYYIDVIQHDLEKTEEHVNNRSVNMLGISAETPTRHHKSFHDHFSSYSHSLSPRQRFEKGDLYFKLIQKECKRLFDVLDVDGKGYLTETDFRVLLVSSKKSTSNYLSSSHQKLHFHHRDYFSTKHKNNDNDIEEEANKKEKDVEKESDGISTFDSVHECHLMPWNFKNSTDTQWMREQFEQNIDVLPMMDSMYKMERSSSTMALRQEQQVHSETYHNLIIKSTLRNEFITNRQKLNYLSNNNIHHHQHIIYSYLQNIHMNKYNPKYLSYDIFEEFILNYILIEQYQLNRKVEHCYYNNQVSKIKVRFGLLSDEMTSKLILLSSQRELAKKQLLKQSHSNHQLIAKQSQAVSIPSKDMHSTTTTTTDPALVDDMNVFKNPALYSNDYGYESNESNESYDEDDDSDSSSSSGSGSSLYQNEDGKECDKIDSGDEMINIREGKENKEDREEQDNKNLKSDKSVLFPSKSMIGMSLHQETLFWKQHQDQTRRAFVYLSHIGQKKSIQLSLTRNINVKWFLGRDSENNQITSTRISRSIIALHKRWSMFRILRTQCINVDFGFQYIKNDLVRLQFNINRDNAKTYLYNIIFNLRHGQSHFHNRNNQGKNRHNSSHKRDIIGSRNGTLPSKGGGGPLEGGFLLQRQEAVTELKHIIENVRRQRLVSRLCSQYPHQNQLLQNRSAKHDHSLDVKWNKLLSHYKNTMLLHSSQNNHHTLASSQRLNQFLRPWSSSSSRPSSSSLSSSSFHHHTSNIPSSSSSSTVNTPLSLSVHPLAHPLYKRLPTTKKEIGKDTDSYEVVPSTSNMVVPSTSNMVVPSTSNMVVPSTITMVVPSTSNMAQDQEEEETTTMQLQQHQQDNSSKIMSSLSDDGMGSPNQRKEESKVNDDDLQIHFNPTLPTGSFENKKVENGDEKIMDDAYSETNKKDEKEEDEKENEKRVLIDFLKADIEIVFDLLDTNNKGVITRSVLYWFITQWLLESSNTSIISSLSLSHSHLHKRRPRIIIKKTQTFLTSSESLFDSDHEKIPFRNRADLLAYNEKRSKNESRRRRQRNADRFRHLKEQITSPLHHIVATSSFVWQQSSSDRNNPDASSELLTFLTKEVVPIDDLGLYLPFHSVLSGSSQPSSSSFASRSQEVDSSLLSMITFEFTLVEFHLFVNLITDWLLHNANHLNETKEEKQNNRRTNRNVVSNNNHIKDHPKTQNILGKSMLMKKEFFVSHFLLRQNLFYDCILSFHNILKQTNNKNNNNNNIINGMNSIDHIIQTLPRSPSKLTTHHNPNTYDNPNSPKTSTNPTSLEDVKNNDQHYTSYMLMKDLFFKGMHSHTVSSSFIKQGYHFMNRDQRNHDTTNNILKSMNENFILRREKYLSINARKELFILKKYHESKTSAITRSKRADKIKLIKNQNKNQDVTTKDKRNLHLLSPSSLFTTNDSFLEQFIGNEALMDSDDDSGGSGSSNDDEYDDENENNQAADKLEVHTLNNASKGTSFSLHNEGTTSFSPPSDDHTPPASPSSSVELLYSSQSLHSSSPSSSSSCLNSPPPLSLLSKRFSSSSIRSLSPSLSIKTTTTNTTQRMEGLSTTFIPIAQPLSSPSFSSPTSSFDKNLPHLSQQSNDPENNKSRRTMKKMMVRNPIEDHHQKEQNVDIVNNEEKEHQPLKGTEEAHEEEIAENWKGVVYLFILGKGWVEHLLIISHPLSTDVSVFSPSMHIPIPDQHQLHNTNLTTVSNENITKNKNPDNKNVISPFEEDEDQNDKTILSKEGIALKVDNDQAKEHDETRDNKKDRLNPMSLPIYRLRGECIDQFRVDEKRYGKDHVFTLTLKQPKKQQQPTPNYSFSVHADIDDDDAVASIKESFNKESLIAHNSNVINMNIDYNDNYECFPSTLVLSLCSQHSVASSSQHFSSIRLCDSTCSGDDNLQISSDGLSCWLSRAVQIINRISNDIIDVIMENLIYGEENYHGNICSPVHVNTTPRLLQNDGLIEKSIRSLHKEHIMNSVKETSLKLENEIVDMLIDLISAETEIKTYNHQHHSNDHHETDPKKQQQKLQNENDNPRTEKLDRRPSFQLIQGKLTMIKNETDYNDQGAGGGVGHYFDYNEAMSKLDEINIDYSLQKEKHIDNREMLMPNQKKADGLHTSLKKDEEAEQVLINHKSRKVVGEGWVGLNGDLFF